MLETENNYNIDDLQDLDIWKRELENWTHTIFVFTNSID